MKNSLVTLLTVILVVVAALLVARIISEKNGESTGQVVSSSTEEETTQKVAAKPDQESINLVNSHAPVAAPKTEAASESEAASEPKMAESVPEESKIAAAAPEQAAEAPDQATEAPDQATQGPDQAAESQDPAVESPEQIAAPSQDSDVPAKAEPTGNEEPKQTSEPAAPEPKKVAQVTEPAPSEAEKSAELTLVSVDAPQMDPALYEPARWHPIHFRPEIEKATNEQCLACHSDVLTSKVLETSPAGVKASESLAWYQTLDTYAGDQLTFHQRHMSSPFATQVMDFKCNFCHQGHDPREESPGSSATAPSTQSDAFTLRKVVNPSQSCLLCHGKFSYEIMALEGPWHKVRGDLEDPEVPELRNGCLTCHNKEGGFRTVRHQVNYLKADEIERLAKEGSSDVCYGCHGGRSWYRISYPYPRHPWPDMDPEVPDWAKNRPTESDPRYALDKQNEQDKSESN